MANQTKKVPTLTVPLEPFTVSASKGEAYSYEIDPSKWTADAVITAVQYGVGVMLQRAAASLTEKAGHTPAERKKARDAVAEKIRQGQMGTRGSSLSLEDQAMRDALEAQKGFKFLRLPTGEKTSKGKPKTVAEPVADALTRFTKEFLERSAKEVNDENAAAVKARLKKTSAYRAAIGDIDDDITLAD